MLHETLSLSTHKIPIVRAETACGRMIPNHCNGDLITLLGSSGHNVKRSDMQTMFTYHVNAAEHDNKTPTEISPLISWPMIFLGPFPCHITYGYIRLIEHHNHDPFFFEKITDAKNTLHFDGKIYFGSSESFENIFEY